MRCCKLRKAYESTAGLFYHPKEAIISIFLPERFILSGAMHQAHPLQKKNTHSSMSLILTIMERSENLNPSPKLRNSFLNIIASNTMSRLQGEHCKYKWVNKTAKHGSAINEKQRNI